MPNSVLGISNAGSALLAVGEDAVGLLVCR